MKNLLVFNLLIFVDRSNSLCIHLCYLPVRDSLFFNTVNIIAVADVRSISVIFLLLNYFFILYLCFMICVCFPFLLF